MSLNQFNGKWMHESWFLLQIFLKRVFLFVMFDTSNLHLIGAVVVKSYIQWVRCRAFLQLVTSHDFILVVLILHYQHLEEKMENVGVNEASCTRIKSNNHAFVPFGSLPSRKVRKSFLSTLLKCSGSSAKLSWETNLVLFLFNPQ